jgi:hypothetical protein
MDLPSESRIEELALRSSKTLMTEEINFSLIKLIWQVLLRKDTVEASILKELNLIWLTALILLA